MPGIVTHSTILKETISHLSKKDKKSYLLKSLEALFKTREHLSAGLFGAIGPNIFDYIPGINKRHIYGSNMSFFIHNGGSEKIMQSMIKKIFAYKDKNNEWAAVQRAYLYGFISHMISDSIFYPFILYYSGFPDSNSKQEIRHYREQNLLFQYNIDNYFQYHDEKTMRFNFNLDEMLPVEKKMVLPRLNHALKSLLLDSIKDSYPEIFPELYILDIKRCGLTGADAITYLDLLPYMIKLTYYYKKNDSRRLANLAKAFRRNNYFLSDFLVQYPHSRRYNKDVLNKHRERWDYPTGKPGLHYESIYNLMMNSCEKTIGMWEKIETCLYEKENRKAMEDVRFNAYTGDPKLSYKDMKIKHPIRLSM